MFTTTYRGIAYPWQCDHMGHMNVMWYTSKFDEASWSLLAEIGISAAALASTGLCMAAIEQRIAYRREVRAGEVLQIQSAMLAVSNKTLHFVHEMRELTSNDVVAVALLTGACMDKSLRVSAPLPVHFSEAARGRLVNYRAEQWFERRKTPSLSEAA